MTEKTSTRAELLQRIELLEAQYRDSHDAFSRLTLRYEEQTKELAGAKQEVRQLKDELHALTIERARLEGYRDRVHEFDPVTERTQYADERHPRRHVDFAGEAFGRTEKASPPWYRRG